MRNFLKDVWYNLEALEKLQSFFLKVGVFILVVLLVILFLVKFIPESKNYNILFFVNFLVYSSIIIGVPFFIGNFRIRYILSLSIKENRETLWQLVGKEKEIRLKIETEKNNEKKQELEQQAFALRQEYESLLSENLLRRDGGFVTDWREVLLVSRKRLLNEEQRLLARNRVHLRIGIFMSLIAVSFLIFYMFFRSQYGANDGFGIFFSNPVPVFSIVAIIQSFSFFFLRLYIVGERELDKNKNEITNIELRLTAGLMMASASDNPDLTSLADALSKEQRNLVLDETESSAVLDPHKFIETLLKLASKGGG